MKKLCEANDIYGCAQKGYLYLDGKGVEQNFERAFEHFSEGCSQNLSKYCVEVGQMYERGLGRPKDSKIAMTLYQRSCDSNNANACYHLANTQKKMSGKKVRTLVCTLNCVCWETFGPAMIWVKVMS